MTSVLAKNTLAELEEAISKKSYMQLVKSKNKQSEVSLIRKDDFQKITGL